MDLHGRGRYKIVGVNAGCAPATSGTGKSKSSSDASLSNLLCSFLFPNVILITGVLFLATGVACCFLPPSAQSQVGDLPIPPTATCLRVQRKPDRVHVQLALGTPPRITTALFRPDRLVAPGVSPLRVFGPRTVESLTLDCALGNDMCSDALLVGVGTSGDVVASTVSFEYSNYATEGSFARRYVNAQAELSLSPGTRYFLTATHLCVDSAPHLFDAKSRSKPASESEHLESPRSFLAQSEDGLLFSTIEELEAAGGTPGAPLFFPVVEGESESESGSVSGSGEGGDSQTTRVDLFPVEAAIESEYLSVTDLTLYQSDVDSIEERRAIVQLGEEWAARSVALERAYTLWTLDCKALQFCRPGRSLPWRRVMTNDLVLDVVNGSEMHFRFVPNRQLMTSSGMKASTAAFTEGFIKLILLILVATTIWVRLDRSESKWWTTFQLCVKMETDTQRTPRSYESLTILEDAVLGVACAGARIGLVAWCQDALLDSGEARLVVLQWCAGVGSVLHWVARYASLVGRNSCVCRRSLVLEMSPLEIYGGSTAMLDGCMAVLILYARPPLLVNDGGFDAVARLLIGILLSVLLLQQCLFAACCCAFPLSASKKDDPLYVALLVFAFLHWETQVVCLASTMVDLIAAPLAYGVLRAQVGQFVPFVCAVFSVFASIGMPPLMITCTELVTKQK
jgi:hypothetical protein